MSKTEFNTLSTAELCEKLWIGLVTTMTTNYVEKGVQLIRNSDIKPNKINRDLINLDVDFANIHNGRTLKTGDVVTVHTGEVGVSSVITKELNGAHGFATINSRLKKEIITPEYYCWFLNSDDFRRQVYQVITGDGRNNLNLNDFIKLNVSFPSLPEQSYIAHILSTADSVIQQTQAAIAKYKAIKQGMLHDLFTRGIDVTTDKLRPKNKDAPELYKESLLGLIPKDWEVERLGNRAIIEYGKSQKAVVSINGTIPVYGTGGLMEYASEYLFDGESILIGRKGTIDKPFYINGKFWTVDTAYYLRSFEGNVRWLHYKLENFGLKRINEATGVPSVNREQLYSILFPFPSKNEQNEIVKRLLAIDYKLQTEQNYLNKLQQIKAGLMGDLLSGRKRIEIKDDLKEMA